MGKIVVVRFFFCLVYFNGNLLFCVDIFKTMQYYKNKNPVKTLYSDIYITAKFLHKCTSLAWI